MKKLLLLPVLPILLLAALCLAGQPLVEGNYVLGVTITGIESESIVLSNCSITRKDGELLLLLKDRYNDKFTKVYAEHANLKIIDDREISFIREYNPTPMANEEKGQYTERYVGRVQAKTGYIGGTVTGQWTNGEKFTGKWILLKVQT